MGERLVASEDGSENRDCGDDGHRRCDPKRSIHLASTRVTALLVQLDAPPLPAMGIAQRLPMQISVPGQPPQLPPQMPGPQLHELARQPPEPESGKPAKPPLPPPL